MSPALSDDEKRQRLREGQPLYFDPLPAEGEEPAQARAARTIKAEWLGELAPKPERVVKVPIDIANAVIEGPLDFQYACFRYEVAIRNSEFGGAADFSYCRFQRNLDLSRSALRGKVTFQAAVFERDGCLDGCVVPNADANFMDLRVTGVLRVCFASFGAKVCFSGATFEKSASFDASGFRGNADFVGVSIALQARFRGAAFWSAAEFDGARVGGDALFRTEETKGIRTEFGGETRFVGAHVGGEADFRGAEFKALASFDGIQVEGSAFFRTDHEGNPTRFEGDVGFMRAHIHGDADFSGAEFQANGSFDGMQVDGSAFFRTDHRGNRTQFRGAARFPGVRVQGNAEFDGARFRAASWFNGMSVGGTALFRGDSRRRSVVFNGPAAFPAVTFVLGAHFTGASFDRGGEFRNGRFLGGAEFAGARFGTRAGAGFRASFVGARFDRGVSFRGAMFAGPADFSAALAEPDARFEGAVFSGEACFRDARIRVAHFRGELVRQRPAAEARQFKAGLDLRGFTYERICFAWEDALARSDYDRQPYTQLEKTLRSSGLGEEADAVYIEQRRRERGMMPPGAAGRVRRAWDWTYEKFAGYGTRPLRLLVFLLALLALGSLVLWQPGALAPGRFATPPTRVAWFDAFGVSLRLLTRIDLPAGSALIPSGNRIGTLPIRYSTYATLQVILGWLTLPYLIASIAEQLRRRRGG